MSFWRKQVIEPALDSDLKAAITEQLEILRHDSANAQSHFALGTLRHFQGQTDTAIALFLRAIELDASYAAPHMSLGRIYAVQGRYDEAWRHAREAKRFGDGSLVEQLQRYSITRQRPLEAKRFESGE